MSLFKSFLLLSFFNFYAVFSQDLSWVNSTIPLVDSSNTWSGNFEVDNASNLISIGNYIGNIDFDGSTGVFELETAIKCGFIKKEDPAGNLIWCLSLDTNFRSYCSAITIDSERNIYVYGTVSSEIGGEVDFDSGAGVYNVLLEENVVTRFLLKLDENGNFIWAKLPEFNCARISIDQEDNIYMLGELIDSMDLDPSVAETFYKVSEGGKDISIVKLDMDGAFLWGKSVGGLEDEEVKGVFVDNTGNLHFTGSYKGNADFDPGVGEFELEVTGIDITVPRDLFYVKLDENGEFIRAKRVESDGRLANTDIHLDTDGNIYISGAYSGTVDFDPSEEAEEEYTSVGISPTSSNMFLLKLDANADFLWVHLLTASTNFGQAISKVRTDIFNNVYVMGFYTRDLDFDPDPLNEYILEGYIIDSVFSVTGPNFFVEKMSNEKDLIFARVFDYGIHPQDFCVDGDNFILSGGLFDTVDFDFGMAIEERSATGGFHNDQIAIAKYGICSESMDSSFVSTCNSYLWDVSGEEYDLSGNYIERYTDEVGCDSSKVLVLSIVDEPIIETHLACGEFTWLENGTTYYESTTDSITYTSELGCDSTFYLNLVIDEVYLTNLEVNTCESFTVPSGDETYTISGIYMDTLLSAQGCDSILLIDLTVTEAINTLVSEEDGVILSSLEMDADGYQWVDCDLGNSPITGENTQSFTATSNGNYAVVITNGACEATSECYQIESFVGLSTTVFEKLNVYPNPTNENVIVSLGNGYHSIDYLLTNALGDEVCSGRNEKGSEIEFVITGENGIYFLHLFEEGGATQMIKIIKN